MVTKFEERFAPELMPLVRPMADIKLHPDNPRTHADAALEAAIAKFGQMTPLTVQASTMHICKGNGTYEAMGRLGYENAAYHIVDMDDATALQYLHVDNRTSDLAAYDAKRTLAGLKALEAGPGLMGMWDQDALEDLEYQVNGVSASLDPEFKGGYADAGDEQQAERQAKDKKPGQKMKEVPIVLSVEEHAAFMADLRAIAPTLGTKGTIATVIAAVHRLAEEAAGRGAPLPAADANQAKYDLLLDLAVFFDDRGKEMVSGANISAKLTELAQSFRPKEAAPKELPGQTHLSDTVDIPEAAGTPGEPLPNMEEPQGVHVAEDETVTPVESVPMALDPNDAETPLQPPDDDGGLATPSGQPYVTPLREPEDQTDSAMVQEARASVALDGDTQVVPEEPKVDRSDVPGGKPTTAEEMFKF